MTSPGLFVITLVNCRHRCSAKKLQHLQQPYGCMGVVISERRSTFWRLVRAKDYVDKFVSCRDYLFLGSRKQVLKEKLADAVVLAERPDQQSDFDLNIKISLGAGSRPWRKR